MLLNRRKAPTTEGQSKGCPFCFTKEPRNGARTNDERSERTSARKDGKRAEKRHENERQAFGKDFRQEGREKNSATLKAPNGGIFKLKK